MPTIDALLVGWGLAVIAGIAILALFFYWLLIITEGVYLGRRVVIWLYDITAHKYDSIKQYDGETEQFFVVRPLLYRLRHIPAPRILDVATGTGRFPFFALSDPTFNGRVYGLDAAVRMLALAQAKLAPFHDRAALVQQTALSLPFACATFDAVTCLESLEFFPSETAALAEIVRVLRPGGHLLVTRRRGWEAKTFPGRYRSTEQFSVWLTDLGLTAVDIQPWQVNYDLVFARKAPLMQPEQ